MIVTFSDSVLTRDTMVFESAYEKGLQMTLPEKDGLFQQGALGVWMFVDGDIAGECFGICPAVDDETEYEDCEPFKEDYYAIYCYGTTVLMPYRGKGLGKLLVATWNATMKSYGYKRVVGHSTARPMDKIREFFGAKFLSPEHEGWYGTDRIARFYVQPL